MPILTRLTRQIKDPSRINIYLDGQYAFALDLETVTRHQLKPKLELTPEKIQQLIHDGEYQRIYNLVLKIIARRPRSEHELDYWFRKKDVPELLITPIKQKLHQLNLINDLEFAKWWIDQRTQHRPKGSAVLRAELQQKGVSSTLISQVLNQLPQDPDQLLQLGQKKLRTLARFAKPQQKQKLMGFFQRRGFNYSQIKPIIDELLA